MVAKKKKSRTGPAVSDVRGSLPWLVFRWSMMVSVILWTLLYKFARMAGETGLEDFVYVNF